MKLPRALARPGWSRALVLAALLAFAPAANAAETGRADVPAYTGYVNDRAGVIGEQRRAQLEAFLDQYAKKTGSQFAVLTMETTAPEEPDAFKVRVFEAWGIGAKDNDEGLLLLLAMQERRIVFETGYGLEGTLPDGWQSTMLRELAVPRLRAGDAEEGITAAVLAAAQRVAAEKGVTLEWNGRELRYSGVRGQRTPRRLLLLVMVALFVIVIVVISAVSSSMGGPRGRGGWRGGGFGGWGGGLGGGGFGGGFGGGGWGGGGGGFGGGGSFGGFGGGGSGGGGGGASW